MASPFHYNQFTPVLPLRNRSIFSIGLLPFQLKFDERRKESRGNVSILFMLNRYTYNQMHFFSQKLFDLALSISNVQCTHTHRHTNIEWYKTTTPRISAQVLSKLLKVKIQLFNCGIVISGKVTDSVAFFRSNSASELVLVEQFELKSFFPLGFQDSRCLTTVSTCIWIYKC